MIITVANAEVRETNWGDKLFITDTTGKEWTLSKTKEGLWKEFEEGYQTEVTLKKSTKGTDYIDTAKKLATTPVKVEPKPIVKQASVLDTEKIRGVALRYAVDLVIGKVIQPADIYIMASLNEQYLNGNLKHDSKDIVALQIKLQNARSLFEES